MDKFILNIKLFSLDILTGEYEDDFEDVEGSLETSSDSASESDDEYEVSLYNFVAFMWL